MGDVVSREEVIRGGMREETFPLVSEMTKMRPIVFFPPFFLLFFFVSVFLWLYFIELLTSDRKQDETEGGPQAATGHQSDLNAAAECTLVNLPLNSKLRN